MRSIGRSNRPPAGVFESQEVLVMRALHAAEATDPVLEVDDVVPGGEFVERGDQSPDAAHRRGARGGTRSKQFGRCQREKPGLRIEKAR